MDNVFPLTLVKWIHVYCPDNVLSPKVNEIGTYYCMDNVLSPKVNEIGTYYCMDNVLSPNGNEIGTYYCMDNVLSPNVNEIGTYYCMDNVLSPNGNEMDIIILLHGQRFLPPHLLPVLVRFIHNIAWTSLFSQLPKICCSTLYIAHTESVEYELKCLFAGDRTPR